MSSFWDEPVAPSVVGALVLANTDLKPRLPRCRDLLDFLAVMFSTPAAQGIGLQPVLTNASSQFSDVSMGGASFDVRRVTPSAFPSGLNDAILKGREYVVVKQPRSSTGTTIVETMDEIATEVLILTHPDTRDHPNIIDLCALIWHNSGTIDTPRIVPALVMEFAQLGTLSSFQARGMGHGIIDKFDICQDVARGLHHMHLHGIIHGDLKASNVLLCKHQQRPFIAKLSDFGFALSQEERNPRIIGYTQHLEAPEIHSPLDRNFLVQLDIYSYGLLVHSVLKNGALSYEVALEHGHPEAILKCKTTNLLPSLLQLNLLMTLGDERCLLLLFCKIIAYCLRADPSERFVDMATLLDVLKWADPRDLIPSLHEGEDLYRSFRFEVALYADSKARLLQSFELHHDKYYEATKDKVPMSEVLKHAYVARMNQEIDMIMSKPQDSDDTHYDCRPGLDLTLWRFMKAVSEPPRLSSTTEGLPSSSQKLISLESTPSLDMSMHAEVVKKMAAPVRLGIFLELYKGKDSEDDPDRCSTALYNLGYCYIDGIGTTVNVEQGIVHIEDAARRGCVPAQKFILGLHAAEGQYPNLDEVSLLDWCTATIRRYQQLPPRMWNILGAELKRNLQREQSSLRLAQFANLSAPPTNEYAVESQLIEALEAAIIANDTQLLQEILDNNSIPVNARNSYGQTLLISACQASNFEAAMVLIRRGVDVDAVDRDGFGALHWLIAFERDQQQALVQDLVPKDIKVLPSGTRAGSSSVPYNLYGGPWVSGTPLHWAISCGDLHAVELLVCLRPDHIRRPEQMLSPLDYACYLCDVAIIRKLIADPTANVDAAEYCPMAPENTSVVVNSLFYLLKGGSRFERLERQGRDYQSKTEEAIKCLVEAGASCEAVLKAGPLKMSAPFATAYHHCNADILQSGLRHGFLPYVNTTFGGASSGGPAMSLAIAQQDGEMFRCLLEAEASVTWRNQYKQDALALVAKELDDTWFAQELLQRGVPIDDEEGPMTPFSTAVYCGNLKVAKYLWEKGANKDSRSRSNGMTVLGHLIGLRTTNAAQRIKFVLGLPDGEGADGFITFLPKDHAEGFSALHQACSPYQSTVPFSEDPESEETCRFTLSLLLQKYNTPEHLNSTAGPHHDVPLGIAVEVGNHHAVKLLLEAGARPSARDEYGRTPLDKLYWRYCFPATLDVLKSARNDTRTLAERLKFVNQNTSDIYSLLTSYKAEAHVFRFPAWFKEDSGYRSLQWVQARLEEDANRPPTDPTKPTWGGMPITIPENPMQWRNEERVAALSLRATPDQAPSHEAENASLQTEQLARDDPTEGKPSTGSS